MKTYSTVWQRGATLLISMVGLACFGQSTAPPRPRIDIRALLLNAAARHAQAAAGLETSAEQMTEGASLPANLGLNGPMGFGPLDFSNGLWLEIELGPTPGYVDLLLHGTEANKAYQLLGKTNLAEPYWVPGQILSSSGLDPVVFTPLLAAANSMQFFRAAQGDPIVSILATDPEAYEPSPDGTFLGQNGSFTVQLFSPVQGPDLTVFYHLSGTAKNGVDYATLPGSVTITNGSNYTQFWTEPLADELLDFDETVTLSLIVTNGYLVDPTQSTGTVTIHDDPFIAVARVDSPVAVDYHAGTNALIISVNEDYNNSQPPARFNFASIGTDWNLDRWSGVSGLTQEVKIATAKMTTNGFTAGDMFFSTDLPGTIGWISSDGTRWTNNWLTLPGETNHIWGSLYVDQTGIWGHDLLAVSGEGINDPEPHYRSVWRIHSATSYTRIAVIDAIGLEGVLTLPDDPVKYGPWAGKLITSDEYRDVIYAIDTNGGVTSFPGTNIFSGGIAASDFDLVQPGQNLYCTLQQPGIYDQGLVLKIPHQSMTNNLGDVMVTRSGETTADFTHSATGKLFFLRWDGSKSNFVGNAVVAPLNTLSVFEHSVSAPIDLPLLPR